MISNLKTALAAIFLCLFASQSQMASAGNVPTEMEGLLNFHEVHPYLYRGGAPDEASLKKLKDEKHIQTLIDLRAPSECKIPEKKIAAELGMEYINLPMASQAPTKKQVDTFIHEVERAKNKESGPVYVHCAHGSDRTGSLVGIWRVTHDGYTYDQAYAEMRKYFFGPKFTNLSGAVKEAADASKQPVSSAPAAR